MSFTSNAPRRERVGEETPRFFACLFVVVLLALAACSTPSSDARIHETTPDPASFPAVSDLLDHRCGTLDCHGNAFRNFRIYGHEGLRLAPTDRPLANGSTTQAEYDATYTSLVTLEPEIMTDVVTSGGASPDRLTLVRKARGAEHHKGGAQFQEGDDQDVCLTAWLGGHADEATCKKALAEAF